MFSSTRRGSVFEGRPASIAVVLDISERRRAERSLKRLNRDAENPE